MKEDGAENAEAGAKINARNIMLASLIFENIKDYGLLHSSQQIIDAVIEGTRLGLPSVKVFLESRFKRASHSMLPFSQPQINEGQRRTCPAIEGEYGYAIAPIWG